MNLGAILDNVAGELDACTLALMQRYSIPPSLMDKVLDRIQSHMRQMKAEEYAEELTSIQLRGEQEETHTGTVNEFKEEMGMKGVSEDADIQCDQGEPRDDDPTV